MKKFISILLLFISIQGCQKQSEKKEPVSESKTQIETVKNFMKWYINNTNKLNNIKTIGGGCTNQTETAKNYFVDFKEVDKYLSELKRSGFLTEKIIEKERDLFTISDKDFKENPVNDDPPYGFDYDHFFLTQESFEEDLPNIDKAKYTIVEKYEFNSTIKFQLPCCGKYKYSLKKINSKWLIDNIETANN